MCSGAVYERRGTCLVLQLQPTHTYSRLDLGTLLYMYVVVCVVYRQCHLPVGAVYEECETKRSCLMCNAACGIVY